MNEHDKERLILEIAKANMLVRSETVCARYHPSPAQDLSTTNSGADFYEVGVDGVRTALEQAFEAGRRVAAAPTARPGPAGEPPPEDDDRNPWQSLTVDDAIDHLKIWIDGIDDPRELANLMITVCGCQRAGYHDDGRIYFKVP